MKFAGGFGAYVTSFFVGMANLAFVTLYVWSTISRDNLERVFAAGEGLSKSAPSSLLLGALLPVVAIVAGHLFDGVGHLLIDDRILLVSPTKNVSDEKRLAIQRSLPEADDLGFDATLESIFLAHAPDHLVAHHERQWDYYELYRNLALTLFLHSFLGPVFLSTNLTVLGSVVWSVSGLTLTYISWRVMSVGLGYYHDVEASFVVGWLIDQGKLADRRTK